MRTFAMLLEDSSMQLALFCGFKEANEHMKDYVMLKCVV